MMQSLIIPHGSDLGIRRNRNDSVCSPMTSVPYRPHRGKFCPKILDSPKFAINWSNKLTTKMLG